MKKQLIFKVGNQYIETTKNSKVNEEEGNYTVTGEYSKGNKVVRGDISIKANAISFIETVDFASEEAK